MSAKTSTKRRQRSDSGARMSRIPGLVWNSDTAHEATGALVRRPWRLARESPGRSDELTVAPDDPAVADDERARRVVHDGSRHRVGGDDHQIGGSDFFRSDRVTGAH